MGIGKERVIGTFLCVVCIIVFCVFLVLLVVFLSHNLSVIHSHYRKIIKRQQKSFIFKISKTEKKNKKKEENKHGCSLKHVTYRSTSWICNLDCFFTLGQVFNTQQFLRLVRTSWEVARWATMVLFIFPSLCCTIEY